MNLFFQGITDTVTNIPEDQDYFTLVRWIVGALLAILATMVYVVRYMNTQVHKMYEVRIIEKNEEITELKTKQEELFNEIKAHNEGVKVGLDNMLNVLQKNVTN